MVGLNWKDDDAAASEWLAQLGNPYSVVAADREGRTAIDFGVYGAPETFFIDAGGLVQYRHVGPMTRRGLGARIRLATAAWSAAMRSIALIAALLSSMFAFRRRHHGAAHRGAAAAL